MNKKSLFFPLSFTPFLLALLLAACQPAGGLSSTVRGPIAQLVQRGVLLPIAQAIGALHPGIR